MAGQPTLSASEVAGSVEQTLQDAPWMLPLVGQLRTAGLEVIGHCGHLGAADLELLRQSPLLEDFTPEEAAALGRSMLRVQAQPGQVLITEGHIGAWMLLVLSGTIDVTRKRPDGRGVSRLAVIRSGASIGEMSMFDGEPRSASCTAIEAVEAGVLGQMAIGLLIQEHPAVGAKLLVKLTQVMAQRLRNITHRFIRMVDEPQSEQP